MTAIKRLTPPEAYAALQAGAAALLLDVRDPLEYSFIGHPVGAVNLPWKFAPDWRPNPEFLERARQLIPDPETPVFLLCRSGQRSWDAANALAAAGYRDLANIEEGFEGPLDGQKHRGTVGGWRCHGLPWEQS
ncbi:rhodanese-like domain-containing protein [Methylomagnum ishizawai]|uniref:rhodanese-like domain-containing protein n=1 Tax=Methylomagnum ishizawai TaxID=1760988 RepID=UPI001C340335|nr:rhodanese-like domain-containing protein [Methylomagnum ishizawai]BBL75829.1 rhodanese-like domain-containing protein [Methylomagnum ishizawai]